MSLQINCDKEYKLVKISQFRLEGDDLFPNDSPLKTTSAKKRVQL